MRIAVVGVGATGARATRQLAATDDVDSVLACDLDRSRVDALRESTPGRIQGVDPAEITTTDVDAVILALPAGEHLELARAFVGRGVGVVSTSDAIDDVRHLLALDPWCRDEG